MSGDFRVVVFSNDNTTVVGALSSTWVDNDYMQSFYGITPEQSLSSGLSSFQTSSGILDAAVQFGINHQFSSKWAAIIYTNYARILGDAADSPIVKQLGSTNQFVGGIFAVYSF
jgi:outer membrane scaffolding protein for murein synthesis (MipA/OmpV family)